MRGDCAIVHVHSSIAEPRASLMVQSTDSLDSVQQRSPCAEFSCARGHCATRLPGFVDSVHLHADNLLRLLFAERYPAGAQYICIDINYFPGYEKLPDYENLMADFLASLFSAQPERTLCRFVSCRQPAGSRSRSRPASAEAMPTKQWLASVLSLLLHRCN